MDEKKIDTNEPKDVDVAAPETTGTPQDQEMGRLKELFREYGQTALIGLTLAVAVFLGFAVFRNYKQSSTDRAFQMLFSARAPEQMQAIVTQYGSTPAAPIALLTTASMSFDAGNYSAAEFSFKQFQQKYPTHPLAVSAALGLAQCTEADGRMDEALAAYETFLTAHADSYLAPLAVLGKARCLEQAGRFDDAKAVYEDFIAAHPDSPWAQQAESSMLFLDMHKRAAAKGIVSAPVIPMSPVTLPEAPAPAVSLAPAAPTPAPAPVEAAPAH